MIFIVSDLYLLHDDGWEAWELSGLMKHGSYQQA